MTIQAGLDYYFHYKPIGFYPSLKYQNHDGQRCTVLKRSTSHDWTVQFTDQHILEVHESELSEFATPATARHARATPAPAALAAPVGATVHLLIIADLGVIADSTISETLDEMTVCTTVHATFEGAKQAAQEEVNSDPDEPPNPLDWKSIGSENVPFWQAEINETYYTIRPAPIR